MIFQNNYKHFAAYKSVCFKGGGSSGDTYDEAYNKRRATIAESQQGMAEDYFNFWETTFKPMEQEQVQANRDLIPYFNFWETTFKPMEQEQVQANRDLIPYEKALAKEKAGAERNLIPGQTGLSQEQTEAQRQLLPGQTQVLETAGESTLQGLESMGGLREKYYDEVYNGLDPEAEATKAGTDASQAFSKSNEIMRRNAARSGIDPNSGRFTEMLTSNAIERSRQIGGASSLARFEAEKEQFKRLDSAVSQGPIQGVDERTDLRSLETSPTLDALDSYTAPETKPTNFKPTKPTEPTVLPPAEMSYEDWLAYKKKYDDNDQAGL